MTSENTDQRGDSYREYVENLRRANAFVKWLGEQKEREDSAGKVARFILDEERYGWPHTRERGYYGVESGTPLLEQYCRCLRLHSLPESSVETFRRVWEEFEQEHSNRAA